MMEAEEASSVQPNKTIRQLGYNIIAKDQEGSIKMVWAASEARDWEMSMEEANTVNLALILAKQRGWTDVQITGCNKQLFQKLARKDVNDGKCAIIIENILDLIGLLCSCSFIYVDSIVKFRSS